MHRVLRVLCVSWAACACRSAAPAAPAPPAVEVAAARAPRPLPTYAFQAPTPWQARRSDAVPVAPPDMAQETWRVLVTQDQPLQRKTPMWQPLPASDTVELKMPEGSHYRCIVPPLQVKAEANGFGSQLEFWHMSRSFLCSTDNFETWSETALYDRIAADGKREYSHGAGVLLREHVPGDDAPHHMFVLMRPDKEKREATVGPPRIVTGGPPQDFD